MVKQSLLLRINTRIHWLLLSWGDFPGKLLDA